HQEVPAGNTRDRLVVTDRNVNHVVNAGLRVVPVQLVKKPRIEEPVGLKLRASNPEPVVMLEDPLAASRSRRALLDKHEDLKLVPSLPHRIPSLNQMSGGAVDVCNDSLLPSSSTREDPHPVASNDALTRPGVVVVSNRSLICLGHSASNGEPSGLWRWGRGSRREITQRLPIPHE